MYSLALIIFVVSEKKAFEYFPIGSNVNLCPAMAAILDFRLAWLPGPIICSDWLKFQRSSSLKLMNWLNPNCKWMIIGKSFTKLLFFMLIGNPRWPPSNMSPEPKHAWDVHFTFTKWQFWFGFKIIKTLLVLNPVFHLKFWEAWLSFLYKYW
jgi:hypothetical protein